MDLISVNKATEIVLSNARDFGVESIDFQKSFGRVLAKEIKADRDFPPFDRVTMDGIAVKGDVYLNGQRNFALESVQFAGEAQKILKNANACIEVMTGASLPIGTDSIIRYEDIDIKDGMASLSDDLEMFKNVHVKGNDRLAGEVLLPKGHMIKHADLAVLATTGNSKVDVKSLPKVAIVTSGDELVEVSETPLPHQIRKSNIYAISSVINSYAEELKHFHIKDSLNESIKTLSEICADYDVIVLSGGVSAGKKDYLPEALKEVGIEKLFHKIAQRPGKPIWFGRNKNTVVFALPGNPVSSFMCAMRYVLPWFKKSIGLSMKTEIAVLVKDVTFKPSLSYFMQVKLSKENGLLNAYPIEGGGSGDLANLSLADAFLELPESESEVFKKGNLFPVWRF
jgi:molybdopterin molybdotransferase